MGSQRSVLLSILSAFSCRPSGSARELAWLSTLRWLPSVALDRPVVSFQLSLTEVGWLTDEALSESLCIYAGKRSSKDV
jgi:hypothetical protein